MLLEVFPHCCKHITQLLNIFGPHPTVVEPNSSGITLETTKYVRNTFQISKVGTDLAGLLLPFMSRLLYS